MCIVRFIIVIAELILCYILQSSVWVNLSFSQAVPDLIMIIVVAVAYMKGSTAGIVYGFCAGLILDLTYGNHLGFHALLYLLSGFLSGQFHRFYRKDDNLTPMIISAGCVFISMHVYYALDFILQGKSAYAFYLKDIILPRVVYTAFVCSILYKLCQLSIHWSLQRRTNDVRDYD